MHSLGGGRPNRKGGGFGPYSNFKVRNGDFEDALVWQAKVDEFTTDIAEWFRKYMEPDANRNHAVLQKVGMLNAMSSAYLKDHINVQGGWNYYAGRHEDVDDPKTRAFCVVADVHDESVPEENRKSEGSWFVNLPYHVAFKLGSKGGSALLFNSNDLHATTVLETKGVVRAGVVMQITQKGVAAFKSKGEVFK
jgi:hypothetical protein